MVLKLDGNLEVGLHVWSEIDNLFRSKATKNLKFISEKSRFPPRVRPILLSNISTMDRMEFYPLML